MIFYVEVELLDAGDNKPDSVMAIELLVAKSSNKTKCM
jgi:hypothetical protein